MGVAHGLHYGDQKSVLWWENAVEGDSLEDQSKGGVSIKMDPKKQDACMWVGFFYPRIETSSRML